MHSKIYLGIKFLYVKTSKSCLYRSRLFVVGDIPDHLIGGHYKVISILLGQSYNVEGGTSKHQVLVKPARSIFSLLRLRRFVRAQALSIPAFWEYRKESAPTDTEMHCLELFTLRNSCIDSPMFLKAIPILAIEHSKLCRHLHPFIFHLDNLICATTILSLTRKKCEYKGKCYL